MTLGWMGDNGMSKLMWPFVYADLEERAMISNVRGDEKADKRWKTLRCRRSVIIVFLAKSHVLYSSTRVSTSFTRLLAYVWQLSAAQDKGGSRNRESSLNLFCSASLSTSKIMRSSERKWKSYARIRLLTWKAICFCQ